MDHVWLKIPQLINKKNGRSLCAWTRGGVDTSQKVDFHQNICVSLWLIAAVYEWVRASVRVSINMMDKKD